MKKLILVSFALFITSVFVCASAGDATLPLEDNVVGYSGFVSSLEEFVIVENDFAAYAGSTLDSGDVLFEYEPVSGLKFNIVYRDGEFFRYAIHIDSGTYADNYFDDIVKTFILAFDSETEDLDSAFSVAEYLLSTLKVEQEIQGSLVNSVSKMPRDDTTITCRILSMPVINKTTVSFYISVVE